MNAFLAEPHPLAGQMGTRWQPARPAVQPIMPQLKVDTGTPVPAYRPPQVVPRQVPAAVRPAPSPTTADRESGREPLGGFLSEIKVGALVHDQGPFSRNKESGVDTNLELLFASPKFLDVIWSLRPHIGANINSSGDTSQIYLGLRYEWGFWGGAFAGFSFGGAVHDGETDQNSGKDDKMELGCKVLFRGSIEAGYRFAGHHSLSLFLDHISNAKLCDTNEGLENVGIRYGYMF